MGQVGKVIAAAAAPTPIRAGQLVEDVPAELFSRRAVVGGMVIDAVHPAFVCGHLSRYPAMIAGFLSLDTALFAVPGDWEEMFKAGAPCHDDPDGTIYPPKDALVAPMIRSYERIIPVVADAEDGVFDHENPLERLRARFPTIGAMTAFLLTSHPMYHFGQISTWRRACGLGPVM